MSTSDTLIDRIFDERYVIKRKLGSGGMADVYLAEDQELGRRVALKLLDDRHASDEQFVERFRREAQSAAGLNHPNIVSIFDRGRAEGTYYIAMEYLDGRTLKELLVRNGPTPIPIAIDYARQILGALSFAHRNGIVHRDIKPHNIIVGGDGRLKVTDFGIARSGTSQMTEAGSIVGTAQYLSPEQARGAPVDPRSDLYSLGIVLYEMLTGKVPFTGDTPVEIAMKHLSQVPSPPSELREGVPHDLDAVVMRALAKDPDQRYGSAEEMDADLARVARGVAVSRETEDAMTQVLSGAGVTAAQTMVTRPRAVAPPAPPVYRPPTPYYDYEEPPPGRSVWPWLLALGLIIAAGVGGWFLYMKVQDQLNKNKPVAVPDVMLLQRELAVLKLRQAGLSPRVLRAPSDSVPKGQVSGENPGGGSKVGRGSTVTLTVSNGPPKVRVPNVVGQDVNSAVTALARLGLNPKIRRIYSGEQADTVTAQQPHAGDLVTTNTTIHINVSRGAKPVPVPDVTGQPYANAKSALEGQGFVVSRVDVQSDQAAQGVVIAEDPPQGTPVPNGSKITLSVSKGPATTQIPDVRNQNQADASSILEGAGLTPAVIYVPVTDPSQDGIVISQDPSPGADAKAGEVVSITIGQLSSGTPGGDGGGTTTT
ncbi:MAG: Stk1 family PASTA domain-containing Ser/Thr kinase, partial [Gaiellaceae bacterium]